MDKGPRLVPGWPARSDRDRRRSRVMQGLCTLFVLLCFLPYPGLAIGNHTGLEMLQVLTLALLPVVLMRGIERRQFTALLLFLVPPAISGASGAVTGRIESLNVVIAVLMGLVLGLMSLLPAGMFAKANYLPSILRGVCIALAVHAAAGAYEVYAFAHGFFPFLAILHNPSYAALAPTAREWVLYVRRPFGLFPEPSAMAAAIGPWLVVNTALLLYPQMLPAPLGKGTRMAMFATTAGGIWLVIWSRSGFVAPLIAALVCISLPRARQAAAQFFIVRRLAFVLLAIATVWAMVVFARAQFGNRLATSHEADPWAERRTSMETALTLPTQNVMDLLFGVGPGQSTLMLEDSKGLDTVFSLTLRSYSESGLLGVFCTMLIGLLVVRAIARSSARFMGAVAAGLWFFGVTVVTSYGMNAIYLFLAVLLSWDLVFPAASRRAWSPHVARIAPIGLEGARS